MEHSRRKVFVVLNPKAGNAYEADELRSALARHFPSPQWRSEIYETTGKEDVAAICRAACEEGTALVVAAGGDGTVVGVANGLVHRQVPLGTLPQGTGNDLYQFALITPQEWQRAAAMRRTRAESASSCAKR